MTEQLRPGRFKLEEQAPPPPQPVADNVVMRFQDIYEVDPDLMSQFPQQNMPAWDTLRIDRDRMDHLYSLRKEFADDFILAGEESEIEQFFQKE